MKSDESNQWRDAARSEMQNFERHGFYVEVSENQLPSWSASTRRAHEGIDMMWVLRKKRGEKGEIFKYKARARCVGTNRSARPSRQGQSTHSKRLPLQLVPPHSNFSVRWDALQTGASGSFMSTPPTSKDPSRTMMESPCENTAGRAPLRRRMASPSSGSCSSRCTARPTPDASGTEPPRNSSSRKYNDDHRVDLVLYVDDCWMADIGSLMADDDLRIFQERFKLTVQTKPKHFLGMNINMDAQGGVKVSADAYVKAKAEYYLPKPLAE
eukprot:6214660-Pleurochrysis_carterae.AAC.3